MMPFYRLLPFTLFLPALTGCADLLFSSAPDVRTQAAADFGCSPSDIDVGPMVGTGSYHATGCGQTAEYSCEDVDDLGVVRHRGLFRHTVCSSDGPESSETAYVPAALAAPKPAHVGPAIADVAAQSTGAGGFLLGATPDQARAACEQASHQYSVTNDRFAACDGVVSDLGAPASADLTFCDGKLCVVSLRIAPQPGEGVASALARWKTALTQEYGSPTADRVSVPPVCYDDITPCLVDHSSTVWFDWRFRSGKRIRLTPRADAARSWLTIAYLSSDPNLVAKPGL